MSLIKKINQIILLAGYLVMKIQKVLITFQKLRNKI